MPDKYPRITVRIRPKEKHLKLKKRFPGRGEVSNVVNDCLDCVLDKPSCLINKKHP